MAGERINSAKSALQVCLRAIGVNCRFNVVSFGASHSMLFRGGPAAYDDESLATATAHVDSMKADMGEFAVGVGWGL